MRGKIEEAKTMAKKKIINDAAKLKELDESDLMGLTGGFWPSADHIWRDMTWGANYTKYLDIVDLIELSIKDSRISDEGLIEIVKKVFPSLRYYNS